MGVLIDIILIAILALSAFFGYKKGLVKLGAKLFAGIIAIIITVIIYKPVSEIIINNTQVDEKIENIIVQNTTKAITKNGANVITEKIEDEILPDEAKNISNWIVYAVTAVVLFLAVKIILNIIISLLNFVANLPILKQFNEIGGIIYGLLRGILIIYICILLIGVVTKVKPESKLNEKIENSYITKIMYKNIVKF